MLARRRRSSPPSASRQELASSADKLKAQQNTQLPAGDPHGELDATADVHALQQQLKSSDEATRTQAIRAAGHRAGDGDNSAISAI